VRLPGRRLPRIWGRGVGSVGGHEVGWRQRRGGGDIGQWTIKPGPGKESFDLDFLDSFYHYLKMMYIYKLLFWRREC